MVNSVSRPLRRWAQKDTPKKCWCMANPLFSLLVCLRSSRLLSRPTVISTQLPLRYCFSFKSLSKSLLFQVKERALVPCCCQNVMLSQTFLIIALSLCRRETLIKLTRLTVRKPFSLWSVQLPKQICLTQRCKVTFIFIFNSVLI